MISPGTVVSLFDHSGVVVRPWLERGYTCYLFDILHKDHRVGDLHYVQADLNPESKDWEKVVRILRRSTGRRVGFAWPPCEDLAVSGNRHLAAKRKANPLFQERASDRAKLSAYHFENWGFRWMIENPVGGLSRFWRKPDVIWSPHQFGGYLPSDDIHPKWPRYIAPRDAYTKKTGAWMGGGFIFPEFKPVQPEILERITKSGRVIRGSRQFMLLGGSSPRTKEVRSLTPRGAARAFYKANI